MAQQLGTFEKVLRFGEGRRLKRLEGQAAYVATLEPEFEKLSDDELAGKTGEFKQRLENGETLEELLFEAFAAVREAAKRALGQRPFDVQIMGGIVLHEGDIAEMKTGEGKTLVATQPLYLNALLGQGVHLVTVNDYLAQRDAGWMGPVYERLGMRAAYIENMMPFDARRAAYEADITYGTNSEFGFDYLRDNMAVSLDGVVQRSHTYAIVDEVDSILIDEARTPLIISGEPETAAQIYYDFARIARGLNGIPHDPLLKGGNPDADYEYDEKHKTVAPGQKAIDAVERALRIDSLYDPRNSQLVNHLIQSLKAESLYKRDVDYVVQDGEDGGEGVRRDLQPERRGNPDERRRRPRRRERPDLQDGRREVRGRHPRHQGAPREGPTGPRRHDCRGDVRVPQPAADAAGNPAQRPEREGARARSRDHQGCRSEGRGHDRDEHGRPRR